MIFRRRLTSVFLLLLLAAASACGGTESAPDAGPRPDAGPDSGTDAGPDSGTDAGPDSGTDAGLDSGVSERRVFVTATLHNGDLGGLDGADQICASQASGAELEGEFKAWLSTGTSSAAERLTHSVVPYVLVDGTVVANDWDDLIDRSLAAPINLDARGVPRGGDTWTGTLAIGDAYTQGDCAAFTSGSGGMALCGSTGSIDAGWSQSATPACSTALRLYCFEQ
jgi:hypothetical protein